MSAGADCKKMGTKNSYKAFNAFFKFNEESAVYYSILPFQVITAVLNLHSLINA